MSESEIEELKDTMEALEKYTEAVEKNVSMLTDNMVGTIVYYVMPNEEIRPAIIVKIWDYVLGTVNLQVFVDNLNDGYKSGRGLDWITSVLYNKDKRIGTWHFIGE